MFKLFLFFIAFFGLCAVALFYGLPWLGEKAANLVPVEAEVQLGESLGDVYIRESKTNDSATWYVNKFIQHLELDDTYKINATIIKSDEINAFALPGGKIFIYSGILQKMNSYEELTALLGHEATHIINRHSLKSICRSATIGIVFAAIFGDASGISAGIISQAQQFKQLDYSRDLETEADNNGVSIMVQNKVEPKGMLDLLKLLKEEGDETPQLMKYLSTHPGTDSRIENISSQPAVTTTFSKNKTLEKLFKHMKRVL